MDYDRDNLLLRQRRLRLHRGFLEVDDATLAFWTEQLPFISLEDVGVSNVCQGELEEGAEGVVLVLEEYGANGF